MTTANPNSPRSQALFAREEFELDATETDGAHSTTGTSGELENVESLAFDEGVNEHDVRE